MPGPAAAALSDGEFAAALGRLAAFETRPFLAAAVSGGPDSLALAILADRWARARGGAVCALSVDHRLRPDSGAEIARLDGWLRARAIRHERLVWEGDKPRSGIQEAARAARYALLADWCRVHGCLNLLTGHHRDDQIETHLIRRRAKSGPDGLAGMSAIREFADFRLLRPLLDIPKARLIATLAAEGQPFILDPSNRDPAFERARLRREESGAAAGAEGEALPAAIRALGTARGKRERVCERLLAQAATIHPGGFAVLDPAPLLAAEPDIVDRALAALAATIGGGEYPVRRDRLARLRAALAEGGGGRTLGGCRFMPWRGRVLVLRELARISAPAPVRPGSWFFWDRRFFVALAADAGGAMTIGALGRGGVAVLNRQRPRSKQPSPPRLVYPVLPALWDGDGLAAVPHLAYCRAGARGPAAVLFRPAAPLTSAGFTVV